MNKTMMRCAVCMALLFPLGGCLSPRAVKQPVFFSLYPAVETQTAPPGTITLGIRPLKAALPIERRIAYLDTGQQLGYRSEMWAEKPSDVLSRLLGDSLAASGRFRDVGDAAELFAPDWILIGELRRCYENRTTHPVRVDAEMRLELRERKGDKNLWSQTLRVDVPVDGGGASATARAMSHAVAALVNQATSAIINVPQPDKQP